MSDSRRLLHGRSRGTALIAAGGLLAGSTVIGLLPTMAGASSHREAPLIAADPAVDNTDVYAFSSPENTDNVTFVANWIPFEEPNGGPNFYPWADDAEYLINIDNDGDAVADLIYRWRFTTEDRARPGHVPVQQRPGHLAGRREPAVPAVLHPRRQHRRRRPATASRSPRVRWRRPSPGRASMGSAQDYVENLRNPAITDVAGGGRTLATQAEDPFFLDLRVFDLLYGGDLSETRTGHARRVQRQQHRAGGAEDARSRSTSDATANPVIGVWSTTTRPTLRNADGTAADGSGFTQVSRLGQPLVNEVVVPTGLKDAFNAIAPDQDAAAADGAVVARVLEPEVPQLIEAIYGIPAPADTAVRHLRGLPHRHRVQRRGGRRR